MLRPTAPRTVPAAGGRLAGVDAVRGLAVLGMFAVHVGPDPQPSGAGHLVMAADGRAPAVFTLLAGFSLALAQRQKPSGPSGRGDRSSRGDRSGRSDRSGRGGPERTLRPLLVRSAVLAALGLALAGLWPGILVILTFFALYFLAAEPFTRLSTPVLTVVAAASTVLGPLLSFLLGPLLGYEVSGRGAVPEPGHLTGWWGPLRVLDALLLSGAYPLLTYLPYVLVGLALGRLCDLGRPDVARRMAGWGAAVAVAAYGAAWLAVEVGGGRERLLATIAERHPEALGAADPLRAVLGRQFGAIPSTSWDWLLIADPYSQTPLETLGNAGVGCALIGLFVLLSRGALARLLRPLTALGAMALSAYVAHALVLAGPAYGVHSTAALAVFAGAALLGAWAWQRALAGRPMARGPLEHLLRLATHGRPGRGTA
ncbi:DUF418 domain-containing protein [Streptomyces antimicrobicus]|uniref:DUF418 domain-containing protein n=1 Tax=Streptomyces antimicrobicus TaxID=2883108 RepID=A0ABS8BE62_9ACTN|nr:DUF418 domain-containing protein [Streptomyces antimicrobicus]MCB5182931.1 DUF418 domain-containing protein [Streptomyces antimicrobicus]